MFISRHTLKWTKTCRSSGDFPHAHTAHFLLNRHMNAGLVESALKAQGRRIIVVDDTEPDDDLVRDMTEVLTSFCARLYGRRAAKRKTDAALKAARDA